MVLLQKLKSRIYRRSDMAITVLVVDDEIPARKRVLKLLESHDDFKVLGESNNAKDAIAKIEKFEPELVFLDIQMPDMDGFSVVSRISLDNPPHIIFATAYDQYALKAFDVCAVDYLLKPFDKERFDQALQRAKEHIKLRQTEKFSQKLLDLVKVYQKDQTVFLEVFTVKYKNRDHYVGVEEVLYIEAAGNYVTLHLEGAKHLYRITMSELEEQLPPKDFLRIHRSIIVNKRYVKSTRYLSKNEYAFKLKNDIKLVSGRAYRQKIDDFLG